jgi:predicted permease
MGGVWQDLRYTLRGLGRAPAVTIVSVLTIGLGIGATAVILSLVEALLLRPLPIEDVDRLAWVQELLQAPDGRAPYQSRVFSHTRFTGLAEGAVGAGIELAAFGAGEVAFRGDDDAEGMLILYTTSNYFDVLGVKPARGRFFEHAEDRPGAAVPVAVVSDQLWRGRLGGGPDVIGRTVHLNGRPVTIIGVAPPDFGGMITGIANDIWLPIALYNQLNPGSNVYEPGRMYWLEVFSRLGPEAAHVEAQLGTVMRALPPERPNSPVTAGVRLLPLTGLPTDARGPVIGFVVMLQIAAGLVLLIASVNVGGVLLARAAARRHEVAVRLAIGAGRGRLLRQLLTESTVLFVLGGGAGLLIAAWGTKLLEAFEPPLPVRLALDLGLDFRVIGISLVIALLTGLIFGLAPAFEATRPGPAAALKGGGRAGGGERRRTWLRNAFVTAQIAFSLLLLCTAGLFTRALQRALAADAGFDHEGVVVASLDPRPHGYGEDLAREFYRSLLERVEALPGVEGASLAAVLPLPGLHSTTYVEAPGQDAPGEEQAVSVEVNTVDVGYFSALRIPLRAGREFTPSDRVGAPLVAVINEGFARRFWPGEDAVGRVFRRGKVELEVIGVVRDAQDLDSREEFRPHLYLPFAQSFTPKMTLIARAPRASSGELLAGIRNQVRELDADIPLYLAGSLAGQFRLSLLPQRLAATMIGAFGLVGLLLATLGIYGVLSFQVGQRTSEIGVRIALGARAGEVVKLILRQGLGMVAVGLVVGLGLALAVARLIEGFLHGVDPGDLLTFIGVPLVLVVVALLASWVPARRAARVDPMVALRAE